MSLELPWTSGNLELTLPKRWRLGVYGSRRVDYDSPEPSPLAHVARALDAPLGVRPFRRRDLSGDQVLIVIDAQSDESVLPVLFRQTLRGLLEAGAAPSRIRLLFANGGSGNVVTREGVYRRLGWAGALPFTWRSSASEDKTSVVFLGKTRQQTPVYLDRWLDDVDLVLCLGSVEPDPVFGFTGGCTRSCPAARGSRPSASRRISSPSETAPYLRGAPPTRTRSAMTSRRPAPWSRRRSLS